MKKIIFLLAGLGLPVGSFAHVKWFAEPTETVRPYQLTDTPVLAWIAIAIALVLIGVILEKRLKPWSWLTKKANSMAPGILSVASIGFGIAFLLFTAYGFIFAPNLVATGSAGALMLAVQAVAGVMIAFGIYERLGALMLLTLYAMGIIHFGFYEMIDALEMLGFAAYAFIIGRPKWRLVQAKWPAVFTKNVRDYALPVLRVGTGLNLIVLGFTEKILAPGLATNFLADHPWNFMPALGFEQFTDYWFIFSAGAVEALFGIFLVLGLVTRLTIVVLAVFLATTLILLGPLELVGHLPHFSIAIVLLLLGAGKHFKLFK